MIGASTGGPGHLKIILQDLSPSLNVPIVIAQHMNAVFIPSFAQQFKAELKAPVEMLSHKSSLQHGGVYICERNCLLSSNHSLSVSFDNAPKDTLYNPCVDTLFHSVVDLCKEFDVLAILLTGIGNDGAEGLSRLKHAGATCIAEDEASAVVFGMPKKAKELIPDLTMLSINEIKVRLERFVNVFF